MLRNLALKIPRLRRAKEELDRLRAYFAAEARLGVPSYNHDHLRVWNKQSDWMQEPAFQRAYRAGAESGHGLGDGPLHIEWRIHVCCWAAWHANRLVGDFVECGTNTGIMSLAICNYLDFDSTGKKFYLYDTFAGIPEEQIQSNEAHALDQNKSYRDCFELAKKNFAAFKSVRLVRGIVPETLGSEPAKVCYLMLDMNIVYPEKEALRHFWPRLVPGAIVLFDDYGWVGYDAQKNAHDDFAKSVGCKILTLPTGQGMLIKS